ncbi:23S rRNA (cytidine1920-2'-O)/16S rRNA (cytidine1409-2'-O)-methyltransferase [Rhizomicrobium palustre]|uniref:23S rRNA (Cytidine1920-2'-O)/16S rRNA (Cytidine1409-2'-O)-methyltransferase n=1 Tax=Rhizomicrobium palustre TaxID=189966 RepID=A0A846N1T7_9PROT|nr:TlyA family RNA methyltransferase [Rhizomicrobium palustre]NIK89271.1 23S rRNA (cytidine1920-2'-O)/16S rRNA (cytidine1409-2'-O)-methyltransferase [Rhizomicrobium palustre]
MPTRADVFLVEKGFAASRSEAQAAIRAGTVTANGARVMKPSQLLGDEVEIAYVKAHPYVSRGALKLLAALDHFELSPEGLVCLDIGASTGGFTEVLLERGAHRVYAVDVGHGQLRQKLVNDERVVSLEGTDARNLTAAQIPEPPQVLVADVSFISLKLALPAALSLARNAFLVALVKPQFEAGRAAVGKGGIVKDEAAQNAAVQEVVKLLEKRHWSILGVIDSPIEGGDGNREFLVVARQA